jgi:hypothetical protein
MLTLNGYLGPNFLIGEQDKGPIVSCYEEDLISENTSIQCELCAANCFHPPAHIYRDWIKGAKTAYLANDRSLLSTAFAED